jgi:hypothetical protein
MVHHRICLCLNEKVSIPSFREEGEDFFISPHFVRIGAIGREEDGGVKLIKV